MPSEITLAPIVTAEEAAAFLRCSSRTVQRLCNVGALRFCKAGNRYRINRDSLLQYAGCGLDAQGQEARWTA